MCPGRCRAVKRLLGLHAHPPFETLVLGLRFRPAALLLLPTHLSGLSVKEVASGVGIPPRQGRQWLLRP